MPSSAFPFQPRHQTWNVQEGGTHELAQELEKFDGQALVFVSHSSRNDEWSKALFHAIRRASEVADAVLERKQQDSWDAIVEALTPSLPLSSGRVVEAKMLARAMTAIIESDDFAKAADIAEIAQFSVANPSSQPNRWKKAGLIFAVSYKGVDLYPLYALELKGSAKPLPIVEKILTVLSTKDDWQKAFWFASPNTYLKGAAPKDLLSSKPQDVLRAAETEAVGIQHG